MPSDILFFEETGYCEFWNEAHQFVMHAGHDISFEIEHKYTRFQSFVIDV